MKRKNRGKKGIVVLKIDISKAYDRVDWAYLEVVLSRLGFCETWISWIMLCVRTVEYKAIVNNDLVGPFYPWRGLRQGDPLSPYLFILCAEGLSALLDFESVRGRLHGIRVSRGSLAISHLMFADDCLFFCQATEQECVILKDVLLLYEKISGQAINFQKSGVLFSSNVNEEDIHKLSDILGVHQPLNTGRYLGLHSLIGRDKKSIFMFLRDRMWRKLEGWRGKMLSKAEELERMMNLFWWGHKRETARGINWLSWERLCVSKKIGGMGFRQQLGDAWETWLEIHL